jgi:FlaA1/EpsC-like NDP-sugar epimerase
MRPGEKLFEELDAKGEKVAKTRHPKIFIGRIATYPEEQVREALKWLETLARTGQPQKMRRILNDLIVDAQLQVEEPRSIVPVKHSGQHSLVASTGG